MTAREREWLHFWACAEDPHHQCVPQLDLRAHKVTGTDCWCKPTVEHVHPGTGRPHNYPIVIHNPADGRPLHGR